MLVVPLLLVAGIGATAREASDATATTTSGSDITIAGFTFEPAVIEVAAGTTVTWTNQDTAAHSVRDSNDTFAESADLAQGATFEATYSAPGEYGYVCGIHDYMRGTVTVH